MNFSEEKLGAVGVLMGGCSPERDISFQSGKAVCQALNEAGCPTLALEINSTDKKEIVPLLKAPQIDVAFIALHGEFGEDGGIQAILEELSIPYTGSDARASRLAMNKVLTKEILHQNGIVSPDYKVILENEEKRGEDILSAVGEFPVVVKPACSGSSIGTTIVREKDRLRDAVKSAFQYGQEVMIEHYIKGQEIAAGILGGEALPLVEIRPKNSFFDFTAKYQKGMTDYIVPADTSKDITTKIQRMAIAAYQLLGCRDFARVDFIFDQKGTPFLLEVNTIPGFTETSLLPMAARQAGCGFPELCLNIARLAKSRNCFLRTTKNYGKKEKRAEVS